MTEPAVLEAACLIVSTPAGEVLVGRRNDSVPFLGGYAAFPGGKVDPGDAETAAALGLTTLHATALREMVEEAGLIPDGRKLRGVPAELRDAPLLEVARTLGVSLDAEAFVAAGRWITPSYSPLRFDTHFFLVEVDSVCATTPATDEFSELSFVAAAAFLDEYHRCKHLVPPPTLAAIEALRFGTAGAAARLCTIPGTTDGTFYDFQPVSGIRALALRTPTLPPATHTNTYLLGHEKLIVVDPATYDVEEREKLLILLEELGRPVEAIFLTHHHPDHVGSAEWLRKQVSAPVVAHPITQKLLAGRIAINSILEEGQTVDLGSAESGERFVFEAIHTPGHAPGHLVLIDRRPSGRSMIVGDMVASIGTIIVDPSEGSMSEYIRQLRRMRAMENQILFPAHGLPIIDGHEKLDAYVAHRLMREEKVFEALRSLGPADARALLPSAYDDVPRKVYPLAERSCLAHLEKLVEDGRASQAPSLGRVRIQDRNAGAGPQFQVIRDSEQ